MQNFVGGINLKWKPLLGILLGLLVISSMATASLEEPASHKTTESIEPPTNFKNIVLTKVFSGKDASLEAMNFLARYRGRLTLEVDLRYLENITFIGISLRPTKNGYYIPAYYIVDKSAPMSRQEFQKRFDEITATLAKEPLIMPGDVLNVEPKVNWEYAGRIDYVTSHVTRNGRTGTIQQTGWYYYYFVDNYRVEYYAKIKIRGDMNSKDVALKELNLHVDRNGYTHETLGDFLPDGHIGPTTSYSESLMIEVDSGKTLRISAHGGYTKDTNDGIYFRGDTHTLNPNDYVDFHFYDFKRNIRFFPDPPAWGESFYMYLAVTMSASYKNIKYGVLRQKLSGSFYFNGQHITVKSAPTVDIVVHIKPNPKSVWYIRK